LAVIVDDATAEFLGLESGQSLQSLFLGEQFRGAKAVLAGKQVIELQANSVKRSFPPRVVGNDEGEVMHKVGCVLAQKTAFFQG
jgi:hypothetical protein